MSRKCYTPEQIISMLREAEVALSQGQPVGHRDDGLWSRWAAVRRGPVFGHHLIGVGIDNDNSCCE